MKQGRWPRRTALIALAAAGIASAGPPEDAAEGERFRFAVVSDTHTGGTAHTGGAVFRKILRQINEAEPDFLVHCGDWIVGPSYDKAGRATADTFLAHIALLDESIAFYPALGNHEGDYESYDYAKSLFPLLQGGGWYSFDHGGAHFFVVENNSDAPDSDGKGYRFCRPNGGINTAGSPQRTWLEEDLAGREPSTTWTFGFGHRTYYGAEQYSGRKNIDSERAGEGSLCRLFEDSGVDVFFSGDQHCYTRTTPIRGGGAWAETDTSTVYLTVGGGGGRIHRGTKLGIPFPEPTGVPEDAYVTGTRDRHFWVLCEVKGPVFHADVVDTSGARIDSFTIRKP